jgi:RHS repeat-associated protein
MGCLKLAHIRENEPILRCVWKSSERSKMGVNWYDYGARMYDPVIGRFTGVDPIADDFPHVTPYNYAENKPINGIDLWGLQWKCTIYSPEISTKFNHAVNNGNVYEQRRLIGWALNNRFPDFYVYNNTFGEKPPNNFVASLVHDPSISGVDVRLTSQFAEGFTTTEIGLHFPRDEGNYFDSNFPVDIKDKSYYGDWDLTAYLGKSENMSEGSGKLFGRMQGYGVIKANYSLISSGGFDFGKIQYGAINAKYIGDDLYINGFNEFFDNPFSLKNGILTNGYWIIDEALLGIDFNPDLFQFLNRGYSFQFIPYEYNSQDYDREILE